MGKVLNLKRLNSHSFKEIFDNFSLKLNSCLCIRLLTIRATNILYTVHEILKTINMYGAVYVVCVIVLIIQTAECSCPCETEQQCKIIKDDNRKEVIMQSFYWVILHTDTQTRVILNLNYIFLNLNDFNLHVTYRYKVTINYHQQ